MDSDMVNTNERNTYEKKLYQIFILSFVGIFTLLYLLTFQWGPYIWRRFILYCEKKKALKEVLNKKYDESDDGTIDEKDRRDIHSKNNIKEQKDISIPAKFSFKKKEMVEDEIKKRIERSDDDSSDNIIDELEIKSKIVSPPTKFALKKKSTTSSVTNSSVRSGEARNDTNNYNNQNNNISNQTSYNSYSSRTNDDYSQSSIDNMRSIRSIQDQEYLESLRQEEERKQQLIFEEQIKEAEKLSLQLETKRKDDLREKVKLSIENSENNESIVILFKTPNINNKKISLKRKFKIDSTVLNMLEYLEIFLLIDNNINIGIDKIEIMEGAPPRRLLTSFPKETTLQELLLVSNSVLWVTLKD